MAPRDRQGDKTWDDSVLPPTGHDSSQNHSGAPQANVQPKDHCPLTVWNLKAHVWVILPAMTGEF